MFVFYHKNSSSPECVLIPPNTKFFDLKNFNNFLDLILLFLIDLFSENFKFPKVFDVFRS